MITLISVLIIVYLASIGYLYITQDSKVFNTKAIEEEKSFELENVKKITFEVENGIVLDGVYKTSQKKDAPLLIYFGGNADDATRFLLHVKNLDDYEIVSFNYRGFVKSGGKPSQKALYNDALKIYDKYAKEKKVIAVGRSLGTGVAVYLASKREVKGTVLITPYNSIASIAKRKYPIFPIHRLLKHKFEADKHILYVKEPVCLIEVKDDKIISKYHFDRLKEKIPNLGLHVELEDTTHGRVLTHPEFENVLKQIIP
ncbi:alpha/beta hydrolase [Sulfurospirillum arcachonense]|uniref:alpha/beta hydrolase n=1 Tax=Sulfurospirillum arcachonense TaxID=57666 RepID=UPI0004699C96|nr:alpha/beta hydrolase [Sulfurospirillum arcachonense]